MKRHTSQRSAIEEVFRTIDRPLSIDEILEAGRRKVGTLNQATVYRNRKILVQDGRLTRVHAPEGGVRYERSGKGTTTTSSAGPATVSSKSPAAPTTPGA